MNRVFICGAFNFPRGGAASNYVQYLGMALKECGYQVHIVSTKNKEYRETIYKGLIIDEVAYRTDKIGHYLDFKFGARRGILNCLIQSKIGKEDIVFVYSHNYWLHKTIQAFCKKRGIKNGAVVVEYFSQKQFKSKLDYLQYDKLTRAILPQYDFLFPISTYIKEKLSGGRAKQLVLPIMADPYEYKYEEKIVIGTRKFIFPAKGKMKDALENMVLAIGEILCNPEADVEFHFCGVKETEIRRILKITDAEAIDKRIILHGWLEYDELVKLYQQMHFLLLARDTNEMNKANFPSKVPELLCYGVIPIASKVGDYTKFYLENEINSFIISGCEVEIIAQAIENAIRLDDRKLKEMSDCARVIACEKFSYTTWIGKISDFMRGIE